MLATRDLRALGHNSARYIHVVTEALKLAFADRERYYGDVATVPLAELLAPAYLAARAALIRPDRAMPSAPPAGAPRAATPSATPAAVDGTTHIAAIDAQGNMIALTPSGGVFRKSAFAPELGCTLSTRSEIFVLEDGHPNALAPGKRPRTTLVSYLICENGAPIMTVGCPGGDDQAQANLQIMLNLCSSSPWIRSRRWRRRAFRRRRSSTRSTRARTNRGSSTSSRRLPTARAPSSPRSDTR